MSTIFEWNKYNTLSRDKNGKSKIATDSIYDVLSKAESDKNKILNSRGLDHPTTCPFRDQVPETIEHIMIGCVFVKVVWSRIETALDKEGWKPRTDEELTALCRDKIESGRSRKDERTLIVLVTRELLKHHNSIR